MDRDPADGYYAMTKEGLAALVAEVERLRAEKEREISARLRDARGFCEAPGNDEYMAIVEEQAIMEARIGVLEDLIDRARVVDEGDSANGGIGIGWTLTLEDLAAGVSENYTFVGVHERVRSGAISAASPVGRALLGRSAGSVVNAELPGGGTRALRVVAAAPPPLAQAGVARRGR